MLPPSTILRNVQGHHKQPENVILMLETIKLNLIMTIHILNIYSNIWKFIISGIFFFFERLRRVRILARPSVLFFCLPPWRKEKSCDWRNKTEVRKVVQREGEKDRQGFVPSINSRRLPVQRLVHNENIHSAHGKRQLPGVGRWPADRRTCKAWVAYGPPADGNRVVMVLEGRDNKDKITRK